ncbi:NAPDH-dependent diflavin reductase [Elasticomyces elasticus]|uniref:NADPH-dependent diflavin oxidoreductase 1 n=1 Tax=Elasticomyces elasticus TaxID=574655 RepID=A0AAN7VXM5_9PEZI|nr:NAPDH-dependent diflavin reductase [Elasticomyces elasticus]
MQSTAKAGPSHDNVVTNGNGNGGVQSAPPTQRTALILYGSETGNAADLAAELASLTTCLHFTTTCLDLDSVSLRDLLKPTLVIFAVSTTGQGEFPQNARLFWRRLCSSALKAASLRKVKFVSFGLGDSSYPRYNVAHRMLCARMLQLGAGEVFERGEGNEQHPEGHSAGFREWIVGLREKIMQSFPLADGVTPIADDVFLEPEWKLELATADGTNGVADGEFLPLRIAYDHKSEHSSAAPSSTLDGTTASVPNKDVLPIKGAYSACLISNERLTAPNHFQDVRLLDLHLEESYEYYPGAVAVIYPKNFPVDVQEFIDLMSWQDFADKPLNVTSTASQPLSPSPLRHLDLTHTHLTLRWLLENVLDIMSIPRRSFFASLAHFVGTATEDEAYQRERLLELANPELIDELWDYTTRPKRTILEVMMDFTMLKIPFEYVLTVLPMIKGRQFSIASGGNLRLDGDDRSRKVELLVAIADPPSSIIKYRRRYGVCTRYISSLQPGQQITVGLQPGYLDVKVEEMQGPILMIGPGTGVAPMRSMIYQRLAWAEIMELKTVGKGLDGDVLIFGCRNEIADYFFQAEWRDLVEYEGLTVWTAFSRPQKNTIASHANGEAATNGDQLQQRKQYVQDKIHEHARRVYEMLAKQNGKVYVCGSSGNMPKSVREAIIDVLVECDASMARDQAEAYVDGMEREGRYKQETW